MLDTRVQGLEEALLNTSETVEEIEDGLNALDTTVKSEMQRAGGQALVCKSLF